MQIFKVETQRLRQDVFFVSQRTMRYYVQYSISKLSDMQSRVAYVRIIPNKISVKFPRCSKTRAPAYNTGE